MQKTYLSAVTSGAIIAKDVYGMDGVLLISKGSDFNERDIAKFRDQGVTSIFVEKDGSMGKEIVEEIRTSMNISDVIHEKTRNQALAQIKKTMVRFGHISGVNINEISKLVEDMIEQLLDNKDFVFALSQIRSIDDYTYQHSVNVGVLSLIIGIDLKLSHEDLKILGIGAILHDIGKIMVSEDILKKPGKLTLEEFEEIKKHPLYGYEILKHAGIDEEAAQIALYHHEKFDGTGYTKGLKSNKIPLYSRIVAVADVYDAMSNDRIYQRKYAHDKVYSEITHLGDTHFDKKIMEKFAGHLRIYPNGTGIILNTNHKGIVLIQNKLYPESPIVRVFKNDKKDIKNLYVDVDLSLTQQLFIKSTF